MTGKEKAEAVERALIVRHAEAPGGGSWCGATGTLVDNWFQVTCVTCCQQGFDDVGGHSAAIRLHQLQGQAR